MLPALANYSGVLDIFLNWFQSDRTFIVKAHTAVANKSCAVKKIENHYGLKTFSSK
jgi:hypothetical protein